MEVGALAGRAGGRGVASSELTQPQGILDFSKDLDVKYVSVSGVGGLANHHLACLIRSSRPFTLAPEIRSAGSFTTFLELTFRSNNKHRESSRSSRRTQMPGRGCPTS